MPGQGRLGDKANVSADAHGCPGCPHPGVGPAIVGSPDAFVNGMPALRVDDTGIHTACCGPNTWTAQKGSATVFFNGKAAFRLNDPSKHCGGMGQLIEGSSDVIVGDSGGGGGGGGGGSGSGGGGSGGGGSGSGGGGSGGGGSGGDGDGGAGGSDGTASGTNTTPVTGNGTSPTNQANPSFDVKVLEVDDVHYHFDSAVLLADFASNRQPAPGPGQEHVTGLSTLKACYDELRLTESMGLPKQKVLVAGHTDTVGAQGYNQSLSELRARGVVAALTGDRSGWVQVALQKSKVEDQQQILKWVADNWGWPCDPGEVNNQPGSSLTSAVRAFQTTYNDEETGPKLSVTGVVDQATWGGFFDVYMEALAEIMRTDLDGLKKERARLQFVGNKFVGFGKRFPLPGHQGDNRDDVDNRRVEILFFDPGEEPGNPDDLYKQNPDGTDKYNKVPLPPETIRIATDVLMQISEVKGLYRPGAKHPDEISSQNVRRAGMQDGYKSKDHAGRIFINTRPRKDAKESWEDVKKKDTQFIELTVTLDTLPTGAVPPHGLRVTWTWSDPDDISTGDMRPDVAHLLDASSAGDDNLGVCDFPTPGANKLPQFEEMKPHRLTKVDDHNVTTLVHMGKTQVRFHGTNVGGDNFIMKVDIPNRPSLTIGKDQTGTMTMWKRMDIEYRKMKDPSGTIPDAFDLPLDLAAKAYEKAMVQLDFTNPFDEPMLEFLGVKEKDADAKAEGITNPKSKGGSFVNAEKPHWFLLISAREFASSLANPPFSEPFESDGVPIVPDPVFSSSGFEALQTPVFNSTDAGRVAIQDAGTEQQIIFDVWDIDAATPGSLKLRLQQIDFHPEFPVEPTGSSAPDVGKIDNYWPSTGKIHDGTTNVGYGFSSPVEMIVQAGQGAAGGTSPDTTVPGQSGRFFAGRTVVLGNHPSYNRPAACKLTVTGSFAANDQITLTVGSATVKLTVGAGESAAIVTRNLTALMRSDPAMSQLVDARRRQRRKISILHKLRGTAGNGLKVEATTTSTGGTLSLSSPTLVDGGLDVAGLVTTITHELGHAFGFPHKCGFHSWQPPAGTVSEFSCTMNYFQNWLYQNQTSTGLGVQRFVTGTESTSFCWRHLSGLRHVHLEDNEVFKRLWKWK